MTPDQTLLRLLPAVLRARDFRLYLEGGKRLTDLWRWGGRAVLGHKPPKVLVELKNSAERGLFAPFPHPLEKRFIKALSSFFPGRTFRLYQNEGSLRQALLETGLIAAMTHLFADPASPSRDSDPSTVSLWRPFLEENESVDSSNNLAGLAPPPRLCEKSNTTFVPILPWPLGPAVLVLAKNVEDSFPAGELIPPVLLAPAARALYNLAAAQKTFASNRRGGYSRITKALSTGSLWQRRGIYLTAEGGIDGEAYGALFRRFLEGGFLLPPSPSEPAILPLELSAGEEARLAELLRG